MKLTVAGESRSSIDGRLVALKDNICTVDQPTTCASRLLTRFKSPFRSTVAEKLHNAGAIIAGKTNLDEFGMGFVSSEHAPLMLLTYGML